MATTSTIDLSTLGWVTTEIEESLKQARQVFEAYVDNTSDDSQLRFFSTHIHQVVGTLEMVELDGAAMLAKEIEDLVESLMEGEVKPGEKVFDVLTRSVLEIPDYLSRLQFGQPDVPIRLIPIVNELRDLHGLEPISEIVFFKPDLSIRPPRTGSGKDTLSEDEYRTMAKKLRPRFQVALLAWLRDTGSTQAINNMVKVLEQLESEADLGVIQQLFWVASGLLEAMVSGALEPTPERKKLLSRLDQQIKKLVEGAGKTDLRNSSEDLVKNILYQIGSAKPKSPKVNQLKQAFDLDLLLGNLATESELGLEQLPTPEVLKSVAKAIGDEIFKAQEALDGYFDPDSPEQSSLAPLIKLLDTMINTLDMLGVPILKSMVTELVETCRAVDGGKIPADENTSMIMARALLYFESSSRDIVKSATQWKQQIEDATRQLHALVTGEALPPGVDGMEVSDGQLSENDFQQLLSVVAEEIRANLSKIEEEFETYASDQSRTDCLPALKDYLNQVQGALQILGQVTAANLVEHTSNYVNAIQVGKLQSSSAMMDALAVCIGTIGAYVDGLVYNRPNLQALVDMAMQEIQFAVTQQGVDASEISNVISAPAKEISGMDVPTGTPLQILEQYYAAWLENNENTNAINGMQQSLNMLSGGAVGLAGGKIEQIAAEANSLLQVIADDTSTLTPEISGTLSESLDTLISLCHTHSYSGELSEHTAQPPASEAMASNVTEFPVEDEAESVELAPPPGTDEPFSGVVGEDDNFDEEIMEIFIEDARDSVDTINNNFPAWSANTADHEAMMEIRRGFHTIKGSGRMVGASEIAEFAWALESMLNQVRDGKKPVNQHMVDMVDTVRKILPEMVSHLEGGPPTSADVERYRLMAHEIAEGKDPSGPIGDGTKSALGSTSQPASSISPANAAPHVGSASGIPAASASSAESITVDPTLLNIFTGEAQGHLATIQSYVNNCQESGSCFADSDIIRAMHTLSGSAMSVGLASVSSACKGMEKLLQEMESQQALITEDQVGLTEEIGTSIETLVQELDSVGVCSGITVIRFNDLAQRVQAAADQLGGATASIPVAPAAPMPTVPPPPAPTFTPPTAAPLPSIPAPPAPVAATAATEPMLDESDISYDSMDPDLAEIFYEEAIDILQIVNDAQARWRADFSDTSVINDLKRALHTFKGGSRMAGAMSLGDLAHNTESAVVKIEQGSMQVSTQFIDLLDEIHDSLAAAVEHLNNNEPVRGLKLLSAKLEAVMEGRNPDSVVPAEISEAASTPTTDIQATAAPAQKVVTPPPAPSFAPPPVNAQFAADQLISEQTGAEPGQGLEKGKRGEQIRVRTELLDQLVSYAGEVSITRARMEQQVYGLRDNLGELRGNVTRFREQLRDLEIQSESQILFKAEREGEEDMEDFDPLEFDRFSRLQQLSRGLSESLHDLTAIESGLSNFASQAETVLVQQARINTDLQEGLMRTRMVGFSTQATRLRHIVRQTARELGKNAQLVIGGSDVELDRNVLERMIGPFEHMIRNALDHGIEPAADRVAAGKPETGTIQIIPEQKGNEIVIRIIDDGRGLNIPAITQKAIQQGLMAPNAHLSDQEVTQFILMPGFSTAESVTHISGRGVGMDVVHNEVRQLGGSMVVETEQGKGTSFTISLPLTLSIAQALMIYVGEEIFAIPLASVINIIEMPVEEMKKIALGNEPLLNFEDTVYPFMHLGGRFGIPSVPRNKKKVPVLLIRSGAREVAVQIDGLGGTKEIVIKTVGPLVGAVQGIGGATIMGDGSVILILDPQGLWVSDEAMHLTAPALAAEQDTHGEVQGPPVVMIVDDSLTVRKITSRHLQKHGMEVLTAKDGLDAVEQLRDHTPDIMLVDIEMPRMDGYELTSRVRSEARLKHIPIIMITSRAGSKHRDKAFSLGVDIYMSKPFVEDELMENIQKLIDKDN